MNDLVPSDKIKSFWNRPEGATGMITLGLLGLGVFFVGQAVLPAIIGFLGLAITAVGKTIVLGVMMAFAAALFAIVTNRKFITLVGYMFKSVMRKLTGWFVEIDPIGIMKNYIDDMIKKKEVMEDRTTKLAGQIRVCENQIKKNTQDANNSLATAKVAREQGKANVFQLNARMAGRLQKSNMTLQDLLTRMQLLYRALKKYSEAADTVIADLTSEVKVREQERNMILASHTAMRAAMAILRGDSDKKEMFDQAMEFVVEDYGKKMGEIEDFMTASQTFIDGLDLQNGVFEEQALKQLEVWEAKADSILLGGEKRLMLEDMTVRPPELAITENAMADSSYNKLFN